MIGARQVHPDHDAEAHVVEGAPYEQMRRVLARHLCGWISGHSAPLEHFLGDADLVMEEAHEHGIRFHIAGTTASSIDGFAVIEVSA